MAAPPKYVYLINNTYGCRKRCVNPAWTYYMNQQKQNNNNNNNNQNQNQNNNVINIGGIAGIIQQAQA